MTTVSIKVTYAGESTRALENNIRERIIALGAYVQSEAQRQRNGLMSISFDWETDEATPPATALT